MAELILVPYVCPRAGDLDMVLLEEGSDGPRLPTTDRTRSRVALERATRTLKELGLLKQTRFELLEGHKLLLGDDGGKLYQEFNLLIVTGALRKPVSRSVLDALRKHEDPERAWNLAYHTVEVAELVSGLAADSLRSVIQQHCGLSTAEPLGWRHNWPSLAQLFGQSRTPSVLGQPSAVRGILRGDPARP